MLRTGEGRAVAVTGADGLARFGRPMRADEYVVAARPGGAFTTGKLEAAVAAGIVLPMPRVVVGAVVDDAGQPVAGAEVLVEDARVAGRVDFFLSYLPMVRGTAIEPAVTTRTGPDGRFRFESIPNGVELTLQVAVEGKATVQTRPIPVEPRALRPVELAEPVVLAPEAHVAGRVVAQVPGATVARQTVALRWVRPNGDLPFVMTTLSDAEGRFAFRGLPAGPASLYLDGMAAEGPWAFQPVADLRLVAGQTTTAEIPLIAGTLVTGLVRTGDGKPLAGTEVSARASIGQAMSSPLLRTTTDAAGRYRFRLFPGAATLYVQTEPGHSNTDIRRGVTVPDGPPTLEVDPFVIEVGTVLAGRVVDATGVPLARAKLTVIGEVLTTPRSDRPTATTDAEGRFTMQRPVANGRAMPLDATVLLRVQLADGREYSVPVVPHRGGGDLTVRVPAFAVGGPKGPAAVAPDEIAGLVVDPQGKPIAGVLADVNVWAPDNQTFSDGEGVFRVKGLRPGPSEIRLSKDGWEPRHFFQQPTGQAGWVVVLDQRTAFEGRVLAPDGSPVARAPIEADLGLKVVESRERTSVTVGRSGPDGRYRLLVEPGMYEFRVRVPGVGVLRLMNEEIKTNEARSLDLQLAPGITFRARVVDAETGRPVAGVPLQVFRSPDLKAVSGKDGFLELHGMLPGRFEDRSSLPKAFGRWWSAASSPRGQKPAADAPMQAAFLDFDVQRGMEPPTIEVERAATVRGRVVDPDGRPVAGATVLPGESESGVTLLGLGRFRAVTDADGAFTLNLTASNTTASNLVAHDGSPRQHRTWTRGSSPFLKTTPGQVVDGVTIRLTRPASVQGQVVDSFGQPVAGQEVRAMFIRNRSTRSTEGQARTRADGTFAIGFLPPGEYAIEPVQAPAWPRLVSLAEGQIQQNLTLTNQPGVEGRPPVKRER